MRILTVLGTRPEAVKLAPLILELNTRLGNDHATCVTGQHRQMLDSVMRVFAIEPTFDLDIMKPGQDLAYVTNAVVGGVGRLIAEWKPDWVVVQGDTTSAFAAALAAFYARTKVAHVEAGLRTGDIYAPWPEEMNRRLVSVLTTQHFAPTPAARAALRVENIPAGRILVTGNTVIDALLWVSKRLEHDEALRRACAALTPTLDPSRRLILVTGHRRENFDGGLDRVCQALRRLADRGDVVIVYPVHLNPSVQGIVRDRLADHRAIHLIAPLDYVPFVWLMKHAHLIITDSGGIQEEAPSLGKPVLVTREVTERMEAIEAGTAQLVGTDADGIVAAASALLDDAGAYARMALAHNPFGDGTAARRIADHLLAPDLEDDTP